MKWVDRHDQGVADLMAGERVDQKVATVPLNRKDVVTRQKRQFTAIVADRTAADGSIDWSAVAMAFQAHVDRLMAR